MSTKQTTSGGIGFAGMLTILFIGLKLTNAITWSWWWVLSPLWIVTASIIVLLIVGGLFAWLLLIFYNNTRRNSRISKK